MYLDQSSEWWVAEVPDIDVVVLSLSPWGHWFLHLTLFSTTTALRWSATVAARIPITWRREGRGGKMEPPRCRSGDRRPAQPCPPGRLPVLD